MKKLHILTWVFALLCLYSCKKDKSTESESSKSAAQTQSESSGPSVAMIYTFGGDPSLIPKDTANKMISSYLRSLDGSEDDLHSMILNAETLRQYLKDSSIKKVKVMFAHTLNYINAGHGGQPSGLKSGALTVVVVGYGSDGNYIYPPGDSDKVIDRAVPCPTNCPTFGSASDDLLP